MAQGATLVARCLQQVFATPASPGIEKRGIAKGSAAKGGAP
jgi:hypothetical protein